jgi:hypothetical protein
MVGWICHIWRTVVQEISAQALETVQYLSAKGDDESEHGEIRTWEKAGIGGTTSI